MGKNGQRHWSLPVFAMHCLGLPLPGSPLAFLHPPLPCWLTRSHPHPSEEGRDGCSWDPTCCVCWWRCKLDDRVGKDMI